MLCKQVRKQLAEMSRPMQVSSELEQHVAACEACRGVFDDEAALDAAFARLRANTVGTGPSDGVEERVFAELNMAARPAVSTSTVNLWTWLGPSVAACAAILFAVLMTTHRRVPPGANTVPTQAAAVPADEPFTAMPYVIPPAPYERTTVVRTEVPLQIMAAAGFDVHGGNLDASTPADVLYGEDGRILAIRLISQTDNFPTKRMD